MNTIERAQEAMELSNLARQLGEMEHADKLELLAFQILKGEK